MEQKDSIKFETAIYGDKTGIVKEKSVLDKFVDGTCDGQTISGGSVKSEEGVFNGVVLKGGTWEVSNMKIDLKGGVGNDFAGIGAGVFIGEDTEVVLDGVEINCSDAVRAAVVAKENSKTLAKNSTFTAKDGELPADYVGTVNPPIMKSTPWMLGIDGNARATNLLDNARATYYNSSILSEKWGALSTDDNESLELFAINSTVEITGGMKPIETIFANAAAGKFDFYDEKITREKPFPEGLWQSTMAPSGYATYSIGGTTVTFAGSTVVSPSYVGIVANGPANLTLTSSDKESISGAYGYDKIADSVKEQKTVAISNNYGIMYHSGAGMGMTNIVKGSTLYAGETALIVKGCGTYINVDNSNIYAGNGIILQVMDNDDAGIDLKTLETTTDYVEKHVSATATETSSKAPTVTKEGSVYATFSNMTLNGDIYNSSGWEAAREADILADYNNAVGGGASAATDLKLILHNVVLTGLITTTEARHNQTVISRKDYNQISVVNNTICIPENAGIIVELTYGTKWNVTGTGYVTSLTVDATSTLGDAKVYVNGEEIEVKPCVTYTGVIKIVGNAEKTEVNYVNPADIATGIYK